MIRHMFLAAVCAIILGRGTLGALPCAAVAASAPPAAPTSVLPLLNRSSTWAGRYHSPLAPFSVSSPWPGHPVTDPSGAYDLFDGGSAEIAVLTEPNRAHLTSAGAEQRLRVLILQESMTPVLLRRLEVAGQRHIAVLAFSGPDGVFAAATFVAARRVWVVQLSSTSARQEQDWRAFQRFLQSLRFEDSSAFSGG